MPRAFESRQLGDRAQRPGSEMALRAIWSSSIRGTRGRPATTCLCRQVPLRCSRGRGLRLYLRLYSLSRRVSAQAQISKIQDAGDAYTRKVELEKRRIDELDRQMEVTPKPAALQTCQPLAADTSLQPEQAMRKRIWEQRESMGGINASRENTAAITKQIAILENRLA